MESEEKLEVTVWMLQAFNIGIGSDNGPSTEPNSLDLHFQINAHEAIQRSVGVNSVHFDVLTRLVAVNIISIKLSTR